MISNTSAPVGLSLNEVRRRVAQFAHDYRAASREQSESQGFWTAFLRCFGIEVPHQHNIKFEQVVRKASGGMGRIDVFQPAITNGEHARDGFLIEQKSERRVVTPAGRSRSNAEEQAYDYLEGGDIPPHQMPRWLITSDFKTIQITDRTKPLARTGRTITFPTVELPEHIDDFLWLTGRDVEGLIAADQEEASVAAARLMATLYTTMTGDSDVDDDTGEDGPVGAVDADDEDERVSDISILLTRVLFCLFADDGNIVRWPTGAFKSFIAHRTYQDGSNLGAQLNALFDTLNRPPERRSPHLDDALAAFPYVNGDLFEKRMGVESFDVDMRQALLDACNFDWSRISPAVFGSMFQTVKSRAARHSDGEHYTTEENILKTLRPLFLEDLRKRIDASTSARQLETIHNEMATMRFVDPACGCGNFLVVAYRELRALELDLLVRLRERRGEADQPLLDASSLLKVTLNQFTGIELHWWPAKIAQVAMFLVDHQANRRMERRLGGIPDRLPLKIAARIWHTNAITSDWNTLLPGPENTTYLFGNPPFVGYDDRSDDQRRELQTVWGTQSIGRLDYVTAWHAKAIGYYSSRTSGEFAFVSTNSIAQGEPVSSLFKPLFAAGWRVKFAHTTFEWTTEAPSSQRAVVHCIIVGFTRDTTTKQRLFSYTTPKSKPIEATVQVGVNAYLVDAPNVIVDKRSQPLATGLPKIRNGSVAGDTNRKVPALRGLDGLVMDTAAAEAIRSNDPAATKYLRPFVGGSDFLNGEIRYCLWMPDGPDPADLAASPELRRRLDNVARVREASTEDSTVALAATPYRFKHVAQPTTRYIIIPRTVSERRTYMALGYLEPDHIVSNGSFWAEDPHGLIFAVASSAMFIAWQKAIGGRIKSDPRFANTLVWNNFPLPDLSSAQRKAIIDAGQAVLAARAADTGRSLAQEYDPRGMTPGLVAAHRALDKAVDNAFGLRRGLPNHHRRLQTLFAHYRDITTAA